MKILAFNGSPRKKGNTACILEMLSAAVNEKGHTLEVINVYEKKISGCVACGTCKRSDVAVCAVQDDWQEVMKKIGESDCFIFASPVYFGQISGPLKCLLDRYYCFFSQEFGTRVISGKKFGSITVSGAPAAAFSDVSKYIGKWFGEFIKLENVGSIVVGSLSNIGEAKDDKAVKAEIAKFVEKL